MGHRQRGTRTRGQRQHDETLRCVMLVTSAGEPSFLLYIYLTLSRGA